MSESVSGGGVPGAGPLGGDSPVLYEVEGCVAHVTLDSPSNRNAISPALIDSLLGALRSAEENAQVRSVRLSHTGNTFCAGADLKATGTSVEAQRHMGEKMAQLLLAILEHPKPIVAVVDGHVRAGGMGIIAAADSVFAGPAATFGLSEVRIGVTPALVSAVVLPRMTQRSASRWFIGGETFSAHEALEVGFITEVCSESEGDKSASGVAGQLEQAFAKSALRAMAESKKLVNAPVVSKLVAERDALVELSCRMFMSEEARAGVQAFQKRQPVPWDVS